MGFVGGSIDGAAGIVGAGMVGDGIKVPPVVGSVGTLGGVTAEPFVEGGASGNFDAPKPSFVTTDGFAGVFGAAVTAAVGGFVAAGVVGRTVWRMGCEDGANVPLD